MPKRNWHRDVALLVVSVLTVGMGAFAAFDISRYSEIEAGESVRHTKQNEAVTADQINTKCVPLEPVLRIVCVSEHIATQREAQRSEEDLQAQQMMARIAFWMAALAFVQSLIGIGGIYFVGRSLDLNAKATEEATRAADAAEKALVAENRPWIRFSLLSVGIDFASRTAEAEFRVENGGKSPALNVRMLIDPFIVRAIQIDKTHVAQAVGGHVHNAPHNVLMSAVVFPGDPLETKSVGRIEELSAPNGDPSTHVNLVLVCTATYRSAMSDIYFHTSMTFMIKSGNGPLSTNQRYETVQDPESGETIEPFSWSRVHRVTSAS